VGVAVEDCESSGDRHPSGHTPLATGGDQQTQQQDRSRDAGLDMWQRHARHAQDAAQEHRADKCSRHCPQCTSALLRGPQTDRDHGEQVIQPEEWVCQTTRKSGSQVVSGMGRCRPGKQAQGSQDDRT